MPPESTHNVTHALRELKTGKREYLTFLWKRYEAAMLRRARKGLGGTRGPNLDQEENDVANKALEDLWNGVVDQRWTQLENRNDLWRVINMIIRSEAKDSNAKAIAQKRDARRHRRETDLAEHHTEGRPTVLGELVVDHDNPADAVVKADLFAHLVNALSRPELREFLLLALSGYTLAEISAEWGLSTSTLRRYEKAIIAKGKELFCHEPL